MGWGNERAAIKLKPQLLLNASRTHAHTHTRKEPQDKYLDVILSLGLAPCGVELVNLARNQAALLHIITLRMHSASG